MPKLSKANIPWLVVFLVLLVDQVSKIIVKTSMTIGQDIPVFGSWFHIYFIENEGMAFGLQFAGAYGKLALSIFRIIAVIFIGWYIHRLIRQNASRGLVACISLIMAGALGNIIDSVFYGVLFSESTFIHTAEFLPAGGGYAGLLHGKVVDMLYFPILQGVFPQWVPVWGGQEFIFFRPVFNIADSAITIGVAILLVFQKQFFEFEKLNQPKDAN
jgi:signal peptidase II